MVSHVRVLAALMLAQGVLALLAGLMYGGMGLFMKFGMAEMMKNDPQLQQGGPPPEQMVAIMTWTYVGMGVVAGVIGLLHVYAGFRCWQFKERSLGMVSLVVGLAAVLTCYCAPTSFALAIYGVVVFLNPSVEEAFRMGDAGVPPDEITLAFSKARYQRSFER